MEDKDLSAKELRNPPHMPQIDVTTVQRDLWRVGCEVAKDAATRAAKTQIRADLQALLPGDLLEIDKIN